MKEERMKILKMLQDGKITAEDAMKLLEALGDTEEEPHRQTLRRQRRRNRQRGAGIQEEPIPPPPPDPPRIQEEVQERIREARATLRASMPKVKNAVREAMPNVNRIVREVSIPNVGTIIQEAMQTASDAFSEWAEKTDTQHPEKAVRQLVETTPIHASDRLSISTPKGHVASEIWDRDEVQVDAAIAVWGTDEAAVNAFAEQIDIHIRRESDSVRIQPRVPKREKDDPVQSVRIDFKLRHPQKVDLDVRAAHGNITLPEIDGAAILNNRHGKTVFEGASGNVQIEQHRGDIAVQRAGGDLSLDAHHSEMRVNAVSGSVTVHAHYGALDIDHIGGNTAVDTRHGPVTIREIGGNLAIKSGHSAIRVDRTDGNVQVENSHAPIVVREIGGEFIAENRHSSIKADRIGGRAVAKNKRGNIALRNVGSDVAVKNGPGATHLENIAGPISLRADRGTVTIENPEAGVMIQSRGGRIAVRPHKPIGGDYAIQNKQGEIELAIPKGSAVDIHGYVGRGQIQTDLPLSLTGTSRTSQVVSGPLNGGGARIALELDRGNLILRSSEGVGKDESDA